MGTKGAWKVTSNVIGGEKMYAVYRLRDISAIDHSGNREICGGWLKKEAEATKLAEVLNCAESR
jgi:hypothetical protein